MSLRTLIDAAARWLKEAQRLPLPADPAHPPSADDERVHYTRSGVRSRTEAGWPCIIIGLEGKPGTILVLYGSTNDEQAAAEREAALVVRALNEVGQLDAARLALSGAQRDLALRDADRHPRPPSQGDRAMTKEEAVAIVDEHEGHDPSLTVPSRWYLAARTLRQALAEVQDKCAHLEIDLSNALGIANEAEDENESLRRKLDAAMKVVEAENMLRAIAKRQLVVDDFIGEMVKYSRALEEALAALESDPT